MNSRRQLLARGCAAFGETVSLLVCSGNARSAGKFVEGVFVLVLFSNSMPGIIF